MSGVTKLLFLWPFLQGLKEKFNVLVFISLSLILRVTWGDGGWIRICDSLFYFYSGDNKAFSVGTTTPIIPWEIQYFHGFSDYIASFSPDVTEDRCYMIRILLSLEVTEKIHKTDDYTFGTNGDYYQDYSLRPGCQLASTVRLTQLSLFTWSHATRSFPHTRITSITDRGTRRWRVGGTCDSSVSLFMDAETTGCWGGCSIKQDIIKSINL